MILKIKYRPDGTHTNWVYIGKIKKLDYSTICNKDRSKKENFDAWYTRKDNIKYVDDARFGIIIVTFDNGTMESYIASEVAYLLNDEGKTTEKLEPWRACECDSCKEID